MLLPTSDILDDKKINDVLSDFGKVYNYMQNHSDASDMLAKLDGVKQVIDAVGEVAVAHSLACSSRLN